MEIRARHRHLPVIMVAERADVDSVLEAVQAGATDFLVRGGRLAERVSTLLGKVEKILGLIEQNRILGEQNRRLRAAQRARYRIVGASRGIQEVIERIERAAALPRPILILGERGTGKELVARAIHDALDSLRPFVAVQGKTTARVR